MEPSAFALAYPAEALPAFGRAAAGNASAFLELSAALAAVQGGRMS